LSLYFFPSAPRQRVSGGTAYFIDPSQNQVYMWTSKQISKRFDGFVDFLEFSKLVSPS
jgi:hypothetical protein